MATQFFFFKYIEIVKFPDTDVVNNDCNETFSSRLKWSYYQIADIYAFLENLKVQKFKMSWDEIPGKRNKFIQFPCLL